MDDTSVGDAFASAAYVRVWRAATAGAAFRTATLLAERAPTARELCRRAFRNMVAGGGCD